MVNTDVLWSLNDIIYYHVLAGHRSFESRGLEVEFDFDPDMPSIYCKDTTHDLYHATRDLSHMLQELTGEQLDAKIVDRSITKLRYSTLFVDGIQVIIIEHNGKPIPDDTVVKLNRQLDEIYRTRATVNPGGRGGNRRAAIQITSYDGKIYIQNYPTWKYSVDTTIEIPVKNS
ncbi:hypothetical protein HYY69_05425 [Candidatus Woesearchaeota archaeon]|nr:hypothetical protein [Candidatus Woesearchaeota archaeon]